MINIKNLTKIYGLGENKTYALNSVSLKIESGEFVSITGSSGSGKSTLLHMIAGVDVPSSGEVFVNDVDINRLSFQEKTLFRRRNIGLIFQTFNLISTLTVEENIVMPLVLDNKKINAKEVSDLILLLNLEKSKNKLPNQLSGGEQQRVAIGRALLSKPRIILADEPTGNLDSANSSEVVNLLRKANSEFGQTVLLVTHDPAVASQSKRQIRMFDGQCFEGERK